MYKLNSLKLTLQQLTKKNETRLAEKRLMESQLAEANVAALKANDDMMLMEKVQIVLRKASDYARRQAKQHIEEIVSSALTVVFGDGCRFRLDVVERASRVEVDYYLIKDGEERQLKPPDFNRGGGVVDVISLALRLAVCELEKVDGILLCDEVGKHVSKEYAPNVAYFLKQYSERFARQILLITHNAELASIGDTGYEVSLKQGESVVTMA